MPTIVDYSTVLDSLTKGGLKSLYYNSGTFGFPAGVATVSRGWVGPEDGSIRESARSIVRQIPMPYAERMTDLMLRVWKEFVPGPVWVMPKSHWAYELEFGSRDWMPGVLGQIGVDAGQLISLNNAAAIEFADGEADQLRYFVQQLLVRLITSDFQMVFSGYHTICTIHTRQQLWWTTALETVGERLDGLVTDLKTNVEP